MKIYKLSALLLLSAFFMCAFIPQASAGHHSRTSFGLSFNFAPQPNYVVAPAPVYVQPAPVYAPAPVAVYRPYGPVYYSAPAYVHPTPRVYVHPSYSYSYWR